MTTVGSPFVRTVLGDIAPESLGRVNYHEHLFQVTPLLPGDELDSERLGAEEVSSMRLSGIDAMVDATPWGLGRNPEGLSRISRNTGVSIVATAGFHREAHYVGREDVLALNSTEMARLCLAELVEGQPVFDVSSGVSPELALGPENQPVRAGMLKAGVDYWSITAFERRALEAVASAHLETGAPVMVHLEHGTCAHEVLDLFEALGVPAGRVVLAHIDRSPDPILYSELASRGAYLGCDGVARLKDWPESLLIEVIARTCEAGFGERVLLGGDVARSSRYLAYGGMPGLRYLADRFVPRLAGRLGVEAVQMFLEWNPRRLLTWTMPQLRSKNNTVRVAADLGGAIYVPKTHDPRTPRSEQK